MEKPKELKTADQIIASAKTKESRLFPFDAMREGQRQFYEDCAKTISQGKSLLAYAPTGIGKTAAAITAAVEYARENDMKVVFTTSRHSQHIIAIDTLKHIAKKHKIDLKVADVINKMDMCPRDDIKDNGRTEFNIACARGRKSKTCPFYRINKLAADEILNDIKHVEESKHACMMYLSCPHATTLSTIRYADVVVADYNYMIDAGIRNILLSKMRKELKDVIFIADEAHNLPDRVRSLYTEGLTVGLLASAVKENKEYVKDRLLESVLKSMFNLLPKDDETERYVDREDFMFGVERIVSESMIKPMSYDDILAVLDYGVEKVINEVEDEFYSSSIAGVLDFLVSWKKEDDHVIRTERKEGVFITPLDPSDYTQDLFLQVHSSILMSGTLYPPDYYADLLGVFDPTIRVYKSPFPEHNRMILIDESVTTLYSKRTDKEFKKIGERINSISPKIPGNVIVFFPSYDMISQIKPYLLTEKKIIIESPEWTKDEKGSILSIIEQSNNFMFIGVQQGSFSEGIDFKENSIKCIIVVGLPIDPPSLEKQSLVKYFDAKFSKGKGIEYAYHIPAFNKVLQSSGRAIRKSSDRCLIALLDERYSWPKYQRFFPAGFKPLKTRNVDDFAGMFFVR